MPLFCGKICYHSVFQDGSGGVAEAQDLRPCLSEVLWSEQGIIRREQHWAYLFSKDETPLIWETACVCETKTNNKKVSGAYECVHFFCGHVFSLNKLKNCCILP